MDAQSVVLGAAVIGAGALLYKSFASGEAGGVPGGVLVCSTSDVPKGGMKDFNVSSTVKVLLVHTKTGEWYATSPQCTHYKAPLSKGVLVDDRVVCPWHAACFNVKTGDVEDAPGLDALVKYPVVVKGAQVYVLEPTEGKMGDKAREPSACSASRGNKTSYVIVGAGAAGATAAETLRQRGFDGRITVISGEKHLPYERIKLSKALSATPEQIQLRSAEFYARHCIDLKLGRLATALDAKAKKLTLDDGSSVAYDKLLLATGGNARLIPCEGHDLDNIHPLRVAEDAAAINDAAAIGGNLVIIGSSFIGMEAAAALINKFESVTVVGMEAVPFERVLGPEIGAVLEKLHAAKGVQFRMKAMLKRFLGSDGSVSGVELESGEVLPADLVVIGAGIIPATKWLDGQLPLERDGSIIVDETMRAVTDENIYVAGDIARFPYRKDDNLIRIEHWDVAMQHGRVAAANMAGEHTPYSFTPFFWTAQHGKNLRYAGNAMRWDEIIVHGSLEDLTFVAYFCDGNTVAAVVTLGADPAAVAAAELMRKGQMPTVAEVRSAKKDVNFLTASL